MYIVRSPWVLASALVGMQVVLLYLFGQPLYCKCGYIQVWEGVVLSVGNSQHITDWYTFSHIIHGVIFYALFTVFLPRTSVATRLVLSIGLESSWEVVENTPRVIEHYRQQALAAGYVGDSILNSVCDVVAMVVGFVLARYSKVWAMVVFVLLLEGIVAYTIRDNLTLNILNLTYPSETVANWQRGE